MISPPDADLSNRAHLLVSVPGMREEKTPRPPRGPRTRHVLMAEAERRVRAGEVRAVVAKDLQIAPSTMAMWAVRGRWRLIDLQREAAGLSPLPLPYYARDDRNITAGSNKQEGLGAQARAAEARDLEAEVRALGEAARVAFEVDDLARAETKLKEARRLIRLADGLDRFAPVSPANRLAQMSLEEKREEVRRLVGLV